MNVFYQIYPLGFAGAEPAAVAEQKHRLDKIAAAVPHIRALGADAVLLNPVCESAGHGYDTADLYAVDKRLGTADEFKALVADFHAAGIRVVLDGVFHHVGRTFGPFRDVCEHRGGGQYRDWFHIRPGDTPYGDGFYYEPWEGHFELVKLNLDHPAVQDYLLGALAMWKNDWGIDGVRLDVAYLLPHWFLRRVAEDPAFYTVGEMIHGDYGRFLRDTGLTAVTDYECYKGLYSSLNSKNLFEIEYSLNRLFGPDPWAVCPGRKLLNFADNHDVSRLYTVLTDKRDLYAAYTILFAMPGTPCVYYGSEYAAPGDKRDGDGALRPAFDALDKSNGDLCAFLSKLAAAKKAEPGLLGTDYRKVHLTNTSLVFARGDVLAAVNIGEDDVRVELGPCASLLTGAPYTGVLPAKSADLYKRS